MAIGFRSTKGKPAAPPYTNGPYEIDQEMIFSGGTTVSAKMTVTGTDTTFTGATVNTKLAVGDLLKYSQTAEDLYCGTAGAASTHQGATASTSYMTSHINARGVGTVVLEDGEDGQMKFFIMNDNGTSTPGSAVITPDNMGGGSSIVLQAIGDSAWTVFTNSKWHFMGGKARIRGNVDGVGNYTDYRKAAA